MIALYHNSMHIQENHYLHIYIPSDVATPPDQTIPTLGNASLMPTSNNTTTTSDNINDMG